MSLDKLEEKWIDLSYKIPRTKIDGISRRWLDIAYDKEHELQKLDIYLPEEGQGPFPVIVNVHGGGFNHCDKRDFHMYPTMYALRRNFAVVMVNYRLSPEVKYPVHLRDVICALQWIAGHGREYLLNIDQVFLWGTSAGGNLVLQAACHKGLEVMKNNQYPYGLKLMATAAFCPAIDIEHIYGKGRLIERLKMNAMIYVMKKRMFGSAKPKKEVLDRCNPTNFIKNGITPLYLMHGDADPIIPIEHSNEFAEKVRLILGKDDFEYKVLSGVSHAGAGPEFFLEDNIIPVLEFFERKCSHAN
jgi:acetyl esterase/lipase